jgi:hypothetical protein
MREGLLAQYSYCPVPKIRWGSVQVDVKALVPDMKAPMPGGTKDVLERLSKAVEGARKIGSNDIDLLTRLCCNSGTIDDNVLKILEGNSSMGNALVTNDVLYILQVKKEARSSQIAAIVRLLPVLGNPSGQLLREALAPSLVDCFSTNIRGMQAMLRVGLERCRLVMQLHVFGKGVQASHWLLPLLDAPLQGLLSNWPTSNKMADINSLKSDIRKAFPGKTTPLSRQLDEYYTDYLIEAGTMDQQNKGTVESLINLWHQNLFSEDKRAVALMIAQDGGEGSWVRRDCLRQLPTLSDDFVYKLRQIFESSKGEPCGCIVNLARLFARSLFPDHKDVACWRSVLHQWLVDQDLTLFEYTSMALTINDWHQWFSDLQLVFSNMDALDPRIGLKVLWPRAHAWVHRMSQYLTTIQQVESLLGTGPTTRCFRAGFESENAENIVQILELLRDELIDWDDGGCLQPAVQTYIALLRRDGSNAIKLHRALLWLSEATTNGSDVCLRVIEIYQGSSPEVAPGLLFGWLQNPDLTSADTGALKNLGDLLGAHLYDDKGPDVQASAANVYITNEVAALLAEAERLSGLRRSLKTKDLEGTLALCAEIGINDTSPLEDEIASLLFELVDVIEMVNENVVKLHFPLTHHTALQRAGMGTSSAQSLIVRLFAGSGSLPGGFCIHLDKDLRALANSSNYPPCQVLNNSSDGQIALCHSQINRATHQLGHTLSRHLMDDPNSLEETYKMLKSCLDDLSQVCIICDSPHGIRLRRSACCQKSACSAIYLQADLYIQLNELREDTQLADLLLTAAQAAITSNNENLIPGRPAKVSSLAISEPKDDILVTLLRLSLARKCQGAKR